MTLEEFRESIAKNEVPTGVAGPLKALWVEARGDWDGAHAIVQDDSSREAAWVHAYLHRKEGDEGNAGYWYSRAGRKTAKGSLDEEWEGIVSEFLRGN